MKKIVLIPTYNEIENILPLIEAIEQEVPDIDILVVDDNSPDGTAKAVESRSQNDERVHLLVRQKKEGLGKAYLAGFQWALERGYTHLIEMDADFSHRPKDLAKISKAVESADFVVGSRYVPGGETVNWNFWRRLISRGGSFYTRMILSRKLYDWTGGFNAWSDRALRAIKLNSVVSEGYSFQIELKYRALRNGMVPKEVPITFEERRVGQSKMSFRIVLEAFFKVWRFRNLAMALLALLTWMSLFQPTEAFAKKKKRKSSSRATQSAVVKTDGAMIYKKNDFDSAIVDYLSQGAKINVSQKTFGAFYKVYTGSKVVGYISDVDITPESGTAKSSRRDGDEENASKKKEKDLEKEKAEKERVEQPIYLTQYVGPTFNLINYRGKVSDQDISTQLRFYGLKISGPDILIKGPTLMDISLAVAPGVPSTIMELAGTNSLSRGITFLLETDMMWPFKAFFSGMIYWGLGIQLLYMDYDFIYNTSQHLKINETQFGGHAALGLAYRIKRLGFRVEPRFYMDTRQSVSSGFHGSLQYGF